MQKHVFDQMPKTVKCFVVGPWINAILFGRDDHGHLLRFRFSNDGISVVASVGKQMLGTEATSIKLEAYVQSATILL